MVVHATNLVTTYCDSLVALAFEKDPKYHGKTKHIDVRYHFITDIAKQKQVVLKHITKNQMVVDLFTKPITRDSFMRYVKSQELHQMCFVFFVFWFDHHVIKTFGH